MIHTNGTKNGSQPGSAHNGAAQNGHEEAKQAPQEVEGISVSRRNFLRGSAIVGGGALLGSTLGTLPGALDAAPNLTDPASVYTLSDPNNILYTSCQNCNTGCGIKVKFIDGVAVKVDGNPFNPWTMTPQIDYTESPANPAVAKLDGAICPRGQAGIQILYDPYRIRKVLKRAGKRGENKWETISFDDAMREIVEGGALFSNVPGEENRQVEGLKEIYALRDPSLAGAMSDDVKLVTGGKMTVAEFQEKYRDNLDVLIDPDHPDFGPKNNQLVFMWGRMKAGRSQMVQRFITDSFGSLNRHGHTTVCQGSLYFACKAMSEQYSEGKWSGGQKFYWQADTGNSQFILFVGANIFEGGYGPPLRTGKITDNLVDGKLRIAVVDPRLSKTAAKAWKWVPALPGSEGAMALAMIQWIIENERYNARYLAAANKAAAAEIKETTWSNAPWLVRIDDKGEPGAFLRVRDLPVELQPEDAQEGDDRFVVLRDGEVVALVADDTENPVHGDLFVDTTVGGHRVKSSMQLLAESANEHTLEEWAEICGIKPSEIVELAREFTSYGKKAAADIHRGVSQHTNGYYNVAAWMSLNLLIGNYDWKGGMAKATTYDPAGAKSGQPYPVMDMHPKKAKTFGYSLIRHEANYEKSTIFEGYPSKRPWYPLSSDIYQETIPSAGDAYPYPIKALILYMGAPTYALPSGDTTIAILSDTQKIPLFIANDVTVGETSIYADYIFPDLTYMERWEFHGAHPSVTPKVQPVRNPVVGPLVDTVQVFGEEAPICLETMLMGLAEKLGVPGFGPNGFAEGQKLNHPDDLYLKMVANVAAEDTPVEDATDEEIAVFLESRRHIHSSVFDPERWQASAGEEWWRKVVTVLMRGGRFQGYGDAYDGEKLRNRYGKQINLYHEKSALSRNSMTGERFPGIPKYIPIADSLGRPIEDREQGYPLMLSTFRQSTQTKSRTNGCYWLLAISPENEILINRRDAEAMGFVHGDRVKISSVSNPNGEWDLGELGKKPVAGRLKVIEGIRPGVITFSLGFGHWANGASDLTIDGQLIPRDERRAKGIHANAVMRVDPHLGNSCLTDLAGGSAVFYDTWVKLDKV
jgi:tetrathionate reductase subunit A